MTGDRLAAVFGTDDRRAAAARGLRAVGESPTAIEAVRTGNRKTTAIARFAEHGPIVVQVCVEQTWLRSEATLLARIRDRTTVPVPAVLASGTHDDVVYLFTAYIEGADLHERFAGLPIDRQRSLAHRFGASLAQLHESFQFDGYGRLEVTDGTPEQASRTANPVPGTLTPTAGSWPAWFTAYTRDALDRLPPEFDPLQPTLREVVSGSPGETAPTARLFPWDLRPGNALVADGDLAAVLDWEAPLAAPAALSVAKTEYLVADWYADDPVPLRDAFREGYASARALPAVRPEHRVAAIADSAVDSIGRVTNPGYPELARDDAVAFHRRALERAATRTQ